MDLRTYFSLKLHDGTFACFQGLLLRFLHLDLQVLDGDLVVLLNLLQVHAVILLLAQLFRHTSGLKLQNAKGLLVRTGCGEQQVSEPAEHIWMEQSNREAE